MGATRLQPLTSPGMILQVWTGWWPCHRSDPVLGLFAKRLEWFSWTRRFVEKPYALVIYSSLQRDPWDWYVYLQWLIFMVNVSKYTIHGAYGYEELRFWGLKGSGMFRQKQAERFWLGHFKTTTLLGEGKSLTCARRNLGVGPYLAPPKNGAGIFESRQCWPVLETNTAKKCLENKVYHFCRQLCWPVLGFRDNFDGN